MKTDDLILLAILAGLAGLCAWLGTLPVLGALGAGLALLYIDDALRHRRDRRR